MFIRFGDVLGSISGTFGRGAHPQAPLGTQKGAGVDFKQILGDFRVSFGRLWVNPWPHFRPLGRPGATPEREKDRKIATRVAKAVPAGILDGIGTARGLVFAAKT